MISTTKASRMLTKRCVGYLASIVNTTKEMKTELSNVYVVCKFSDVFPEDLLRLPPNQDIKLFL